MRGDNPGAGGMTATRESTGRNSRQVGANRRQVGADWPTGRRWSSDPGPVAKCKTNVVTVARQCAQVVTVTPMRWPRRWKCGGIDSADG